MTLGDLRRIEVATGRTDFHERRAPTNPAYADQDDDPLWRDRVFAKDGTRRVLRRRANGNCTFLGEAGCVLALEVRPLACRIYPYQYTEAGIHGDLDQGCPRELLRPGQSLIDALGMHRADAERWRDQLYRELLDEPSTAREDDSPGT